MSLATQQSIYSMIINLHDGNLYDSKEIAELLNINVETVELSLMWHSSEHKLNSDAGDGSGIIYYMDIKYDTIVDGPNFRNTVYCAKCNVGCKGCQNPQSWDIRNGEPITINKLAKLLLENGNDITFSGGECSLQAKGFTKLAKILKQYNRNIWLYSGKTYEELISSWSTRDLLYNVDVLVDGRFIDDLKDENLLFKGSSNQRIIDLSKTRYYDRIVLWSR